MTIDNCYVPSIYIIDNKVKILLPKKYSLIIYDDEDLQDAINKCPEGGSLLLMPGEYNIPKNTSINIIKDINIFNIGINNDVCIKGNTNDYLFNCNAQLILSNISIECNKCFNVYNKIVLNRCYIKGNHIGIKFYQYNHESEINKCKFINFYIAILINNDINKFFNNYFTNCTNNIVHSPYPLTN